MTCRTRTDEATAPGTELFLEDHPLPGDHDLGRARFEAGAAVAAACSAESTPSAKVIYELDSEFVAEKGGVSAAVAEATDLTNIATAQYMLQAGVELDAEIFIDTNQSPTGHSYTATGAVTTPGGQTGRRGPGRQLVQPRRRPRGRQRLHRGLRHQVRPLRLSAPLQRRGRRAPSH